MSGSREGFVRLTVAGAAQVEATLASSRPLCFPFNCDGKNTATGTNGKDGISEGQPPTISAERASAMSTLEDLADRVERLLLRHDELKRTAALLEQQLAAVAHERDSMRARLSAARSRIDALLERLPKEAPASNARSAR